MIVKIHIFIVYIIKWYKFFWLVGILYFFIKYISCVVIALYYAVSFMLCQAEKSGRVYSRTEKIAIFIPILLFIVLTPSMLLSYTKEGAEKIRGLQGRYYLPVLPLLMLLMPKSRWKVSENSSEIEYRDTGTQILYLSLMWISVVSVYYMMYKYSSR